MNRAILARRGGEGGGGFGGGRQGDGLPRRGRSGGGGAVGSLCGCCRCHQENEGSERGKLHVLSLSYCRAKGSGPDQITSIRRSRSRRSSTSTGWRCGRGAGDGFGARLRGRV